MKKNDNLFEKTKEVVDEVVKPKAQDGLGVAHDLLDKGVEAVNNVLKEAGDRTEKIVDKNQKKKLERSASKTINKMGDRIEEVKVNTGKKVEDVKDMAADKWDDVVDRFDNSKDKLLENKEDAFDRFRKNSEEMRKDAGKKVNKAKNKVEHTAKELGDDKKQKGHKVRNAAGVALAAAAAAGAYTYYKAKKEKDERVKSEFSEKMKRWNDLSDEDLNNVEFTEAGAQKMPVRPTRVYRYGQNALLGDDLVIRVVQSGDDVISFNPEEVGEPINNMEQIRRKAETVAAQAGSKAREVGEKAKVVAQDVAANAGEKAKGVGEKAKVVAQDVAANAGEKAKVVAANAGEKAKEVGDKAKVVAQDVAATAGVKAKETAKVVNNKAQDAILEAQIVAEDLKEKAKMKAEELKAKKEDQPEVVQLDSEKLFQENKDVNVKDKVAHKVEDLKETVGEKVEQVKETVGEKVNDLKNNVEKDPKDQENCGSKSEFKKDFKEEDSQVENFKRDLDYEMKSNKGEFAKEEDAFAKDLRDIEDDEEIILEAEVLEDSDEIKENHMAWDDRDPSMDDNIVENQGGDDLASDEVHNRNGEAKGVSWVEGAKEDHTDTLEKSSEADYTVNIEKELNEEIGYSGTPEYEEEMDALNRNVGYHNNPQPINWQDDESVLMQKTESLRKNAGDAFNIIKKKLEEAMAFIQEKATEDKGLEQDDPNSFFNETYEVTIHNRGNKDYYFSPLLIQRFNSAKRVASPVPRHEAGTDLEQRIIKPGETYTGTITLKKTESDDAIVLFEDMTMKNSTAILLNEEVVDEYLVSEYQEMENDVLFENENYDDYEFIDENSQSTPEYYANEVETTQENRSPQADVSFDSNVKEVSVYGAPKAKVNYVADEAKAEEHTDFAETEVTEEYQSSGVTKKGVYDEDINNLTYTSGVQDPGRNP